MGGCGAGDMAGHGVRTRSAVPQAQATARVPAVHAGHGVAGAGRPFLEPAAPAFGPGNGVLEARRDGAGPRRLA